MTKEELYISKIILKIGAQSYLSEGSPIEGGLRDQLHWVLTEFPPTPSTVEVAGQDLYHSVE